MTAHPSGKRQIIIIVLAISESWFIVFTKGYTVARKRDATVTIFDSFIWMMRTLMMLLGNIVGRDPRDVARQRSKSCACGTGSGGDRNEVRCPLINDYYFF